MLDDLQNKLFAYDRQFTPYMIWKSYKRIDSDGKVDELNMKTM